MCGKSQVQASRPRGASTECVVIHKCRQACLEAQAPNVRQFASAGKHAQRRRYQTCGNSQVQASTHGGAGTEGLAIQKCRQPYLEAQAPNVAIHKCGQACLELDPLRVELKMSEGPRHFAFLNSCAQPGAM